MKGSGFERFRVEPDEIERTAPKNKSKAPSKKSSSGKFVCGPIPLVWVATASRTSCRAAKLAWAIWYARGFRPSRPVKLGRALLDLFGISKRTADRALRDLEGARLIQVSRRKGRLPLVTVLRPEKNSSDC